MMRVKQYDTVLKNEPWAKKHSAYADKWMNSKAGEKGNVALSKPPTNKTLSFWIICQMSSLLDFC